MKVKLTKGELKRQRDALRQYRRYLPTLQLKKQQLQMEILRQVSLLEEKRQQEEKKRHAAQVWAGLLVEPGIELSVWIHPQQIQASVRNIAGVDIPIFERADFSVAEYDLFLQPLWVDSAIETLRILVSLRLEQSVIERGIAVLRSELRTTTQRVNLFEKVKIPEAEDAIRSIKIYIGDQMANAVGRSKAAKRKIEQVLMEEMAGAAA